MASPQIQTQPGEPARMPFVLHALGFRLRPDADIKEGSITTAADPSSLVPYLEMPKWNVSHLATRTYSFRPLTLEDINPPGEEASGEEQPDPALPAQTEQPQADADSDAGAKAKENENTDVDVDAEATAEAEAEAQGNDEDEAPSSLPYITEVPELTPEKLNEVFPKFLINVRWNEITNLLLSKWKKRELRSWEFNEWKDMCKTIKKCPVFETDEEKTAWKRAFINDAVMWIVAIDFRWKFDDAEKIFRLLDVDLLSLIYRGGLFGLWIEGTGEEKKSS